MSKIEVVHNPDEQTLRERGVSNWGIWTKEKSEFPWHYDSTEWCYFLAGRVTVTPNGGSPVTMGKGDLVRFPAGMSCVWQIHEDVRKHYLFEND